MKIYIEDNLYRIGEDPRRQPKCKCRAIAQWQELCTIMLYSSNSYSYPKYIIYLYVVSSKSVNGDIYMKNQENIFIPRNVRCLLIYSLAGPRHGPCGGIHLELLQ